MHYIYGLCDRNARQAAALYRERYPNARHPDHRIISRLHVALSEGRFPGVDVGRGHEGRQRADGEEEVLAERKADPTTSVRDIERRTGVPKSRVQRILKKDYKYHPYHVQRVQTLQPRDYAQRVVFCRRMLRQMREDNDWFDTILWSDESTCRKDGFMNMHNLHSW